MVRVTSPSTLTGTGENLETWHRRRELGRTYLSSGPHRNVLKIGQPPVFTCTDADQIISDLDLLTDWELHG